MKTIIAGSRTITCPFVVDKAVKLSGIPIHKVICGGARGVDHLGNIWAGINKIPVIHFRPDWDTYGKSAGFIRNQEMADYADALIAVWDGVSRGTKDMIDRAQKKVLKVYVYRTDNQASS